MAKGTLNQSITPMHQLAREHYLAGQIDASEELFRQLIEISGDDAVALHGIALIDLAKGQIKNAIEGLERTIAIEINNSEYWTTFGIAHSMDNNLPSAKRSFQKALKIKQNNLNARYNYGLCLLEFGETKLAIVEFRRVLKKEAKNTDALLHLGVAYLKDGKTSKSAQIFKRCLQIDPLNTNARINLGNVYQENKQFTQAICEYENVLQTEPKHIEALYNLALALKGIGKFGQAISKFREVLNNQPQHIGALNNLGTTLEKSIDKEEALSSLKKAAELVPDNFIILYNLAHRQTDFHEWEDAEINYKKVLKKNKGFKPAITNLANLMRDTGRLDEAMGIYQGLLTSSPDLANAHSDYLANLNYIHEGDNEFIYREALEWNQRHGTTRNYTNYPFKNKKTPTRRLKIGYVSPDFQTHSNNYFFAPLLAAHNSNNVETFCFSDNLFQDDTTRYLMANSDHWRTIFDMTDQQASKFIRNDKIDILVDMTGHMAKNRLTMFAQRPSPIQVTWLGYPNTTGLTTMDYRLVDEITDPKDLNNDFHSETVVRLPDGFLCYSPPARTPTIVEPPYKENGFITFGSFNNLAKVTSTVIETWAKCLNLVPNSRLFIKALALSSGSTRKRLYNRFEEHGIQAERIELAQRVDSTNDHLSLYGKIDIALDTFPYNGTTTTFESLWMGVPVISLIGKRHAARVGGSILLRLSLNDLVAESQIDYVKLAANLAANQSRLIQLRRELRTILENSNFFNYGLFASKIEQSYRNMWINWCNHPT